MPGLLSSPVCLTVVWFLSWSLHPSCAQIWTDEVSDVQYGRLGSNVTLACGESKMRAPVVWQLNRTSALPWHKVTSDGDLVLLQVNHSAQGNYSCSDSQGLLLHSVKLRLGHPPGLLSVSCRVPNHTYVRCSWVEPVKTFLPAKYNASLRGTSQEWRPCIVDAARRHCYVDHPPFWSPSHILRITMTNALGSETTIFVLSLHKLLKPDPPQSVSAKEVVGQPKKLNLSWAHPSSWPERDAFPLIFQIRYKPVGSGYWSEIESEEKSINIVDALAGHLNEVQVRARDGVNSMSQWSEWSSSFKARPWSVDTTPEPAGDPPDDYFQFSTVEVHTVVPEEEGNLGLAILLVLFSLLILTTVLSFIFAVWVRQKRRNHVTKQELNSMVKMKSMPI